MPIALYDPALRQYVNTNPVAASADSAMNTLLVNIFIEMQVHSYYLFSLNPGLDEPSAIRNDIVNSWPVNG